MAGLVGEMQSSMHDSRKEVVAIAKSHGFFQGYIDSGLQASTSWAVNAQHGLLLRCIKFTGVFYAHASIQLGVDNQRRMSCIGGSCRPADEQACGEAFRHLR